MLNLKNIKKKNKLGRTGPGCHLLRMRFQAFPPSPIKSNLYPVSKVTLFFFHSITSKLICLIYHPETD